MAPENWTVSCVITGHLVSALRGKDDFWTADHSDCLQEGQAVVQKRIVLLEEEALVENIVGDPVQGAYRLQRAAKAGAWLMVKPFTVNGKELGVQ